MRLARVGRWRRPIPGGAPDPPGNGPARAGYTGRHVFGAWRYLLAMMVVFGHYWSHLNGWVGVYAVFGFYTLSGFLMTLVLTETYPYSAAGLRAYALNRFLRVYVPYYVVAAATLVMLAVMPWAAPKVHQFIKFPASPSDWLLNATILGLDTERQVRLIPPAWSLHVEVAFYIAMALLLSRHRRIVLAWFLASLAWTIWALASGKGIDVRYPLVEAASLPFSAGALVYAYAPRMGWRWHGPLAAGLFLANAVLANRWPDRYSWGFYVSLCLAVYAVAALRGLDARALPERWVRIDRVLGNLAYPIFLVHWLVACVLAGTTGIVTNANGAQFWAGLVPVHLAAWALWRWVDVPINRLRDRVRSGARDGLDGASERPSGAGPKREQRANAPA
jgi:peptidoglycan/LPS O-acetylase OafA/YrhL